MIAITSYLVEDLGLTLPAACIETTNLNTSLISQYQDGVDENNNPIMRNTIVNYKVWANEAAYLAGKNPVATGTRLIEFTPANRETIDNIALNLAFPESTIQ